MNNINPLNAELNPICHLLALIGTHHILHVSRIRVNVYIYIHGSTALVVLDLLIVEVSRSHSRHITIGSTPLGE